MIKEDFKITVEIWEEITVISSSEWIVNDWTLETATFFFPKLRSGNRRKSLPKLQNHYFYTFDILKLSAGTVAMLHNVPVLYTGIYDYSTIFHHFAKRMVLSNCPYGDQTKFLHDYFNIFILQKNKEVRSLESGKKKN